MKTTHLLKAAGSIACVVFALNVSAQTTTASGPADTSMGQKVDDSAITTKVKSAILAEPGLKSAEINVETFKGIVQLSGFVANADNAGTATRVAQAVHGVKSVKNDIRVK